VAIEGGQIRVERHEKGEEAGIHKLMKETRKLIKIPHLGL
jgi:hypothetical protein